MSDKSKAMLGAAVKELEEFLELLLKKNEGFELVLRVQGRNGGVASHSIGLEKTGRKQE